MRHKLDEMLSDCAPKHGDLMRSAVRYFDHFWTQVFRYQNDGEYTIDNNLAERFISLWQTKGRTHCSSEVTKWRA